MKKVFRTFNIYDKDHNFLKSFDSIQDIMKEYDVGSSQRLYQSIKTGEKFFNNKYQRTEMYIEKSVKVKVPERKYKKKSDIEKVIEMENKGQRAYSVFVVNRNCVSIEESTAKDLAERYEKSVSTIRKVARSEKEIKPGVFLTYIYSNTYDLL